MEKIVVVNDSATFKAEIDKARLTVVHFWASWAAQVSPPISIHTYIHNRTSNIHILKKCKETFDDFH